MLTGGFQNVQNVLSGDRMQPRVYNQKKHIYICIVTAGYIEYQFFNFYGAEK